MNTLYINKSKRRKILSCAAAAAVAFVMTAAPVSAAQSSTNIKDETVYVVTESDGSTSDIIVSDHLKNKNSDAKLKDATTLTDIENTKGDEKYKKGDNGTLTWAAEGSDIYYQGKTDKDAPVAMSVKYYLDDKEVSGSSLEGKSGRLKIKINYENNAYANVNGSSVKVPFVVLTGMIIENDCFENVTVSSGKVIDDGEKSFIVGMAAPGLAESLGLSESELGLGSTVEITGDADKFVPEDLMTVVTNDFFQDIDTDEFSSLDVEDQIDELDSAAKELVSGTDTLYAGIHKLSDSSAALSDGVKKLDAGASALSLGTGSALSGSLELASGTAAFSAALGTNLGTLKTGAEQLEAGSSRISSGVLALKTAFDTGDGTSSNPGVLAASKSIKDGITSLKTGTEKAKSASIQYLSGAETVLEQLYTTGKLSEEEYSSLKGSIDKSIEYQNMISVPDALTAGAAALDSGLNTIYGQIASGDGTEANPGLVKGSASVEAGAAALADGLDKATADTGSLTSSAEELAAGAQKLSAGESELSDGAEELAEGMSQLSDKSVLLINGINQLDLGSETLNKGMQKFYEQGIAKIVKLYNSELKGTVNNAEAVIKAGRQYNTFTEVPDGMNGTVKFIYRTKLAD